MESSSRVGNDDCQALERASDTLLYTSEKAEVAQQVQKDLSLPDSAIVGMSQEDLAKCGGEPMVALPAKSSLATRVKTKVVAGAEAAKTGIKTSVDTVKKKTKEKVEGEDAPSN